MIRVHGGITVMLILVSITSQNVTVQMKRKVTKGKLTLNEGICEAIMC